MIRIPMLFALLAAATPSRGADGAWLRSLPGDGRSGCCYGLAADPRDGAWFLGSFPAPGPAEVDGVSRTGFGDADAMLLHVTADGRIDRSRVIGGAGPDHATELAVAGDGSVYAVMRFGAGARVGESFLAVTGDGESALLRFDPDGRPLWAVEVPGTGEEGARAIAADPTGGVVIAGTYVRAWSRGDVPEIYVAKYRSDGTRAWQRRCEGTGRALAVDADGEGNVYLGAASPSPERGSGRMSEDGWPMVQCIDARGGLRWTWEPERGPEERGGRGRAVAVVAEPEGGCRVLGEVEGPVRIGEALDPHLHDRDLFLARLDGAGKRRWATRFGGPGEDAAFDLARGTEGSCVVTGTFRGTAFLDPWTLTADAPSAGFVAEWDGSGACAWARVLEGAGADEPGVLPYEVAGAPDGATWVAGWHRGILRLGDLSVEGAADDAFLGRILPGGSTR